VRTAHAARLLADATSADALHPILAALGFPEPALPVSAPTAATLGVPHALTDVRLARGTGALRALVAVVPADLPLRDAARQLAARVAARSPHLLWLVALAQDGGALLATWSADHARPRVAAVVVDTRRVVDSDAETLCALAAATQPSDLLTHARWLDVLGRESLTRRFYRALERVVSRLAGSASGRLDDQERGELALLHTSRLLFLSFLEAKGWLDGDRAFLSRGFARCMTTGGAYHRRVLLPLCFGTLNTPLRHRAPVARAFGRVPFLNGGLFAPTPLERRHRAARLGDEELGAVFGDLLDRYRFTAREDSTRWSEAAVDPEMLGKAFESLMAARDRRASGAFYTPQSLVERATDAALRQLLGAATPSPGMRAPAVDALLAGAPVSAADAAVARSRLAALRVLDPACGSGAFLVHALERVSALLVQLGDPRPLAAVRRSVLTTSIFGVDVNPTAVWLCELRLWLSVVVESHEDDPRQVPPLPNLDHHIRVGDALAGDAFDPPAGAGRRGGGHRIAALRARYARATGARKLALVRQLDDAQRRRALAAVDHALATTRARRRELLAALRGRDLFDERRPPARADQATLDALRSAARALSARRRALAGGGALPFSFGAHFGDAADAGGFDLVLGNPPWVRIHHIASADRADLRERFAVFRGAAWAAGADAARAGRGFAAQIDLSALFVERSLALVRPGGIVSLLLPAKLWRSLAGGGVRRLLATHAHVAAIDDWTDAPAAFDAAVYPSLLVAERRPARSGRDVPEAPGPAVAVGVHGRSAPASFCVPAVTLAFDDTPGSPWLLVPPPVRRAFDRLRAAGTPLCASGLAVPLLGVKSGCNEAFVVHVLSHDDDLALVRAGTRTGHVERALLRPLLRGDMLASLTDGREAGPADEHLVWTHDPLGRPLDRLPPHAARWLAPWRRTLAARTDVRGPQPWWSLFRTDGARSDLPRVVWSDFGRRPIAVALPADDPRVPLNSCYVARCATWTDARALAALLSTPEIAAWLDILAEPARGGYHRYLAWTVAQLPIPRDWSTARDWLARSFDAPGAMRACSSVAAAYAVAAHDLAPLLDWSRGLSAVPSIVPPAAWDEPAGERTAIPLPSLAT
jgi:hypothetical protein